LDHDLSGEPRTDRPALQALIMAEPEDGKR
jgi:hypothetical protein